MRSVQMSDKYKVVGGSQSAHCCFETTVIDTTKPEMIDGKHYNNEYAAICECFEVTDAEDIVNALNSHDKLTEQIKVIREVLEDIANEAKSYQERTGKSVTWLERATKALEVSG